MSNAEESAIQVFDDWDKLDDISRKQLVEHALNECLTRVQAGVSAMAAQTGFDFHVIDAMGPVWTDWISIRRGKGDDDSRRSFRQLFYHNFKSKTFDRWNGTDECRGDKHRVLPACFAIGSIAALEAFNNRRRGITYQDLVYGLEAVQPSCHAAVKKYALAGNVTFGPDDCGSDEVGIFWLYCS